MENKEVDTPMTTKAKILVGTFVTALASATVLGSLYVIKKVKNKLKKHDDTTETTDDLDNETPVRTNPSPKPHTSLPAAHAGSPFPLRLRSKGDTVKQLQLALIRSYGAGILPKSGADGDFGTELEAALKSKGYTLPLSEADYQKITQDKQPPPPAPLLAFDSAAIAKGMYNSIIARDFNSSITLLKAIKDTSNYALVSEKLKEYYINGVRQTLVNAMLNTFTESSQRAKVQDTLKSIGLKYDGYKWSLSGLNGLRGVKTSIKEGSPVKSTKVILASESSRGLIVLPANIYLGKVRYLHNGIAVIDTGAGGELRVQEQFIKEQST